MSDSDDSDLSSSYSSDGEVITSFGKDYGSSSSFDESNEKETVQQSAFPTTCISADERTRISSVLSTLEQPSFTIYPHAAEVYMAKKHAALLSRLKELPRRHISVVATRSLLELIDGAAAAKPAPKAVLCDVCVFSPTEPVLVLTITSGMGKKDKVTAYSSQLTRRIVQAIRGKTKYSFSAVCGVVEESLCQSCDKFREKISQMQRDAHVMSIPPSLVMTQHKCLDILQPILQLLPVDVPSDSPQTRPTEQEDEKFSISRKDFNALTEKIEQLMKRTEQLEQTQTDFKAEKDKLHEEIEQMKQDHLTDVRLSLLMRPRSSSDSESTVSGYGSTEVDVEVPHIQVRNRELSELKDKSQMNVTGAFKMHPELTTEAIETGDVELVQYNRDVTLHQACSEGKLDVVRYILSKGVSNINCRTKRGRTPLMESAGKGQVAVFDFLVSQGSDLSAVDDDKNNVLHYACVGGNIDIIRKLVVNKKYDIESREYLGRTPVLWAARCGQNEVFDFLVSRGSDLTVVDNNKNTILHVACYGGNVDIVRYIMSHNIVDIESRGFLGRTPVMAAAETGNKEVFDFLVSRCSDLTTVDNDKDTILHLACYGGNVDIVEYIMSHNIVDIESRGAVGRTPVMAAAMNGKWEVFDFLVSRGSDLTVVDNNKDTILHVACYGGNVDIVMYIMSHNIVDIESRGIIGRTPVIAAADKGKKEVFDFLVSRGSELTVVDNNKDTILHLACGGGNVDIVKYILSHTIVDIESRGFGGRTPVMMAAGNGTKELFDFLESRGSDLTVVDNDKNTILHLACYGGNVDIVKYILSQNIVDLESRGFGGCTPVMAAVVYGKKTVFDCLVSEGSQLKTQDDDKNTILHGACYGGSVDMVIYLLTLSAVQGMEKVKNKYGQTPVEVAEGKIDGSLKLFRSTFVSYAPHANHAAIVSHLKL